MKLNGIPAGLMLPENRDYGGGNSVVKVDVERDNWGY
jgi:hypothetical protein